MMKKRSKRIRMNKMRREKKARTRNSMRKMSQGYRRVQARQKYP